MKERLARLSQLPLARGAARALPALALAVLLGAAALALRLPAESAGARQSALASPGLTLESALASRKGEALDGLVVVPKVYRLAEDALVAPKPDPDGYGTAATPEELRAVTDAAAALIDGRELVWQDDIRFVERDGIRYYRDESILVLIWSEQIALDKQLTFAEVIVADASQLRRKLASDVYGAGIMLYPTEMAKRCNAVAAINGDFYRFRTIGTSVYQRFVYRATHGDVLDSCFFDSGGNMIFAHAGELLDVESTQRFVDENDILFGVCFGPILVEDGKNVAPQTYLLGEVYADYPRACIGQMGPRHYLLMTVGPNGKTADVAQIMAERGCDKAYALDGGQSTTIVLDGKQANRNSRYRSQRSQSDIIYFASAIPEGAGG